MKIRFYDKVNEDDEVIKFVTYFEENEDHYYFEFEHPTNDKQARHYTKRNFSFTNISEGE